MILLIRVVTRLEPKKNPGVVLCQSRTPEFTLYYTNEYFKKIIINNEKLKKERNWECLFHYIDCSRQTPEILR